MKVRKRKSAFKCSNCESIIGALLPPIISGFSEHIETNKNYGGKKNFKHLCKSCYKEVK